MLLPLLGWLRGLFISSIQQKWIVWLSFFQTGVEEMFQLLKAENSLLQSQLDDMKSMEADSQATIKNQEITINSLKTEKEVGNSYFH